MIAKFMQLRISQFAAAIPIIGYLLLWSGGLASFLEAHPALQSRLQLLTILGRLKLIYLGSLFLAAGWVIYLRRCPKIIQRHQAVEDYIAEQGAIRDVAHVEAARESARDFLSRPGVIADAIYNARAPRTIVEKIRPSDLADAINRGPLDVGSRGTILRADYLAQEIENERALRLCALVIAVGLVLLAIPSIETFVLVMWKFFIEPVTSLVW